MPAGSDWERATLAELVTTDKLSFYAIGNLRLGTRLENNRSARTTPESSTAGQRNSAGNESKMLIAVEAKPKCAIYYI
jgi:hypothetical protein